MLKNQKKALSDLYPKPKSYDQLKVERDEAQAARQPRFVALKIAAWSSFAMLAVLAAYGFIAFIMNDHLSSAGAVISRTSFSFLICLAGMAVLFYLYTLVSGITRKTSLPDTTLYVILACLLVVSGLWLQLLARNQLHILFASFAAIVFNFAATYFAVNGLLKRR